MLHLDRSVRRIGVVYRALLEGGSCLYRQSSGLVAIDKTSIWRSMLWVCLITFGTASDHVEQYAVEGGRPASTSIGSSLWETNRPDRGNHFVSCILRLLFVHFQRS